MVVFNFIVSLFVIWITMAIFGLKVQSWARSLAADKRDYDIEYGRGWWPVFLFWLVPPLLLSFALNNLCTEIKTCVEECLNTRAVHKKKKDV